MIFFSLNFLGGNHYCFPSTHLHTEDPNCKSLAIYIFDKKLFHVTKYLFDVFFQCLVELPETSPVQCLIFVAVGEVSQV